MNKALKQKVYEKYNGFCAYTGKPLGNDWQIDHIIPKAHPVWFQPIEMRSKWGCRCLSSNDFENLTPSISIINHYKRCLDLEGFRDYMKTFHKRLSKLPKNPKATASIRRKEYLLKVANLFGITPENPFGGKFYFEI